MHMLLSLSGPLPSAAVCVALAHQYQLQQPHLQLGLCLPPAPPLAAFACLGLGWTQLGVPWTSRCCEEPQVLLPCQLASLVFWG